MEIPTYSQLRIAVEKAHDTFQAACTARDRDCTDEEEIHLYALAKERRDIAQSILNNLIERERHAYINTKGDQKRIRINLQPPQRARLLAKLFRFDI